MGIVWDSEMGEWSLIMHSLVLMWRVARLRCLVRSVGLTLSRLRHWGVYVCLLQPYTLYRADLLRVSGQLDLLEQTFERITASITGVL